uniref:Putative ovule protein n=1 Tax=Solanum chacoense TaxID=4108 RepID=A0A0V0I094_SOLCH
MLISPFLIVSSCWLVPSLISLMLVFLDFFVFFHVFIHLSFLQGMLKMALMYVPKSLSRMVFGLSHSPSY